MTRGLPSWGGWKIPEWARETLYSAENVILRKPAIFKMLSLASVLLIALGGCASLQADAAAPADLPTLQVMSFNIRYGKARDGANRWEKRRELCVARIRAFDPDLLGLQESLEFQNAYVLENLECDDGVELSVWVFR